MSNFHANCSSPWPRLWSQRHPPTVIAAFLFKRVFHALLLATTDSINSPCPAFFVTCTYGLDSPSSTLYNFTFPSCGPRRHRHWKG